MEERITKPELSPAGIKHIQDVIGTFAWYSRASEPTMTVTLSYMESQQTTETERKLIKEVKHFLDYCATHPNAGIMYVGIDMILALHSDASYLLEPNSKRREAGYFYLTRTREEACNNGVI